MILILYPYTAERRDVLENTLPDAQEISQGRGFCTPRPERLPEENLEGRGKIGAEANTVPRDSIDMYTSGSKECIE